MEKDLRMDDVNIFVKVGLRPYVAIGIFICMLSQNFIGTAFGTALPTMIADMGITQFNLIGLLFTAGILVSAIFTPMAANLSKRIGRKKLFMSGALINFATIAVMYFTKTLMMMIVVRAVQGLGGAFIFATGLSLIGDVFPSDQRAKWLSGYGVITSIGSLGGPVLAGLLVDNYNWRYIFIIAAIVAVVGTIMVLRTLPKDEYDDEKSDAFDYLGSVFLGASLVLILGICITGGTFFPWNSGTTYGLALVGIILFVLFIQNEKKAVNPIFPLTMLKYNAFNVSFLAVLLNTLATMALTTYLPSFVQVVLGKSATASGAVMAAVAIVSLIFGPLVGQITARKGNNKVFTLISTIIVIGASFGYSVINSESNFIIVWIIAILLGCSLGVTQFIFTSIVQNGVESKDIALGTGGIQLGVTVGAMLGIAITGIIMAQYPDFNQSLPFMFKMCGSISVVTLIVLLFLKEEVKTA